MWRQDATKKYYGYPIAAVIAALLLPLNGLASTINTWENFTAPLGDSDGEFFVHWDGHTPVGNCISRRLLAINMTTDVTTSHSLQCSSEIAQLQLLPGHYRYEGSVVYTVGSFDLQSFELSYSGTTTVMETTIQVPPTSPGLPTLSWSQNAAATVYRLEQRKRDKTTKQWLPWSDVYQGSDSSYTVAENEKLEPGKYQFRVRACRQGDCGEFSELGAMDVFHTPSKPKLFVQTNSSGSTVAMNWQSLPHDDVYYYELSVCERKPDQSASDCHYHVYPGPDGNGIGTAQSFVHQHLNDSSRYRYKIRACSPIECSPAVTSEWVLATVDATKYLRRQLYYNEANTISDQEEQLGRDGDFWFKNQYARDQAAFRYLDLMYTYDGVNAAVNTYFHGEEATDITTLFGDDERDRAVQVQRQVLDKLQQYPKHNGLRHLFLDIFYDRSVAQVLIYNQYMDAASLSKYNGESIDDEIAAVTEANTIAKQAVEQYFKMLSKHGELFAELTQHRDQVSPRYYKGEELLPLVEDDQLSKGNKDVVLIYQLLARVLESQARLTALSVEPNGDLPHDLLTNLETTLENVIDKERILRRLLRPILGDEIFYVRDGFDPTALESFGLVQAVSAFEEARDQALSTQNWVTGKTGYMDLPKDAQFVVQRNDVDVNFNSFDEMVTLLALINPFGGADTAMKAAQRSYEEFRYHQDEVATQYLDRNGALIDELFYLLGVDVTEGCDQSVLSETHYQQCLEDRGADVRTGQLALQQLAVEQAHATVLLAQQQLDNQISRIREEVIFKFGVDNVEQARDQLIIDYGHKQLDLMKQIDDIEKAIRLSRIERDLTEGFLGGMVNTLSSVASGNFLGSLSGFADVAKSLSDASFEMDILQQEMQIADLERMKEELSIEHTLEMRALDAQIADLEFVKRINVMRLDLVNLHMSIEQAKTSLQQEVIRMDQLNKQVMRLLQKVQTTNAELASRFFADPIHAKILTDDMVRADAALARAKRWLVILKTMFEDKWQREFSDVRHLAAIRNGEEALAYYEAMVELNLTLMSQSNNTDPENPLYVFSVLKDGVGVDVRPDQFSDYDTPAILEAYRSEGDPEYLTFTFSTAKPLGDDLAGLFFFGSGVRADDPTCVGRRGIYQDKIESLAVNIVGREVFPNGYLPTELTYGRTSVERSKIAGEVTVTDVDADGNTYQRVTDKLRTYTPKFLKVPDEVTLQNFKFTFEDYHTDVLTTSLDLNINYAADIERLDQNYAFRERSVAAEGWRLSIKVGTPEQPVIDLKNIKDIQLIFKHRFKAQDAPWQPHCPFGPLFLLPPSH